MSAPPPSPHIDVVMEEPRWAEPGIDWSALANQLLEAVNRAIGPGEDGEAALLLCGDATICHLNETWRNQSKPTNVLSFPDRVNGGWLGDIALAFETTSREAGEQGKSLKDHAAHLILHGLLHLRGFDHITEEDAASMESLERRILSEFGVADPYA